MSMPIALGSPVVTLTARRFTLGQLRLGLGMLAVGLAVVVAGGSLIRSASDATAAQPVSSGLASAPLALRTAASAAIGAQASRYAAVRTNGSLVSSGGGLSTSFTASGLAVHLGTSTLGMAFAGIGYGAQLARPGYAAPTAALNTVSYRRAGVTEWYRNGPAGLEQGFTLQQRPAGNAASGPLTIALRTSGAALSQHGSAIRIAGTSASYGGLTAFDAAGHKLPSTLMLQHGTLLLRVEDAGARYPLTIDPIIGTSQMFAMSYNGSTGPVGTTGAVGTSVSLSADGTEALVGAPGDNGGVGAAWIFMVTDNGAWDYGTKLTASGETGAGAFGSSVSLSSDGTKALVGAPSDANIGAAWAFTLTVDKTTDPTNPVITSVTQDHKFTGSGQDNTNQPTGAKYGAAVALSGDGMTALISAKTDYIVSGGIGTNPGSVWAYRLAGGTWSQQGSNFTGTGVNNSAFMLFGASMALSEDGNTAIIGAPANGNGPGSAWVFTSTGSTFSQQGPELNATDEVGAGHFGTSVALSDDGNTALIGGPNDDSDNGAAWAFNRSGSTWSQQGPKLVGDDESGAALFGTGVALSANGNTALVGGPGDAGNKGAGWLYVRSSGSWAEQGTKMSGTGTTSNGNGTQSVGTSAALSDDGLTSALGSPTDFDGAGSVFGFHVTAPDAPTSVSAEAFDSGAEVQITSNDSAFTSYTVTASPGGATATGSATWYGDAWVSVMGLTNGVDYTFTVTATNQLGTSAASAPSNTVTPVATPVAEPTPTPAPVDTTTTTPVDATPPTATATPASSGTVTSDDGTTVTWPAGTFSAPVTVSVMPATLVGKTTFGVGTSAVDLTIKNAAGAAVTSFTAPIELVFANVPANALPAYSHDGGLTWTAIPLISGTTLPAGYPDGYFRDAAGSVHMLTLHATAFGTLAAGSVLTSALQVTVAVQKTLNLHYGHTIAVHVQSTLPGTATIVLKVKGKSVVTMKHVLKAGSQVVKVVLPKSARHTSSSTLTVSTTASTDHKTSVTKIALVGHKRK